MLAGKGGGFITDSEELPLTPGVPIVFNTFKIAPAAEPAAHQPTAEGYRALGLIAHIPQLPREVIRLIFNLVSVWCLGTFTWRGSSCCVHPLSNFSNFPRCFKASSTSFFSNAARRLTRSSLTSFF